MRLLLVGQGITAAVHPHGCQARQLGVNYVLGRVVAHMQYAIGANHSGGRIGISWLRV